MLVYLINTSAADSTLWRTLPALFPALQEAPDVNNATQLAPHILLNVRVTVSGMNNAEVIKTCKIAVHWNWLWRIHTRWCCRLLRSQIAPEQIRITSPPFPPFPPAFVSRPFSHQTGVTNKNSVALLIYLHTQNSTSNRLSLKSEIQYISCIPKTLR